jgi:hypothetical protein
MIRVANTGIFCKYGAIHDLLTEITRITVKVAPLAGERAEGEN